MQQAIEQEEERYHTEMICMYCGEPMIEPWIPCCGEVHFDTQANLDKYEREQTERLKVAVQSNG